MDDPNSALPSDPSVDESYTKSSRPARPRARSGARAGADERDVRRDGVPVKERSARARSADPTPHEADAAHAPTPRRLSSDGWYRLKLARRLAGVAICMLVTGLISHVALSTSYGQVIDTMLAWTRSTNGVLSLSSCVPTSFKQPSVVQEFLPVIHRLWLSPSA